MRYILTQVVMRYTLTLLDEWTLSAWETVRAKLLYLWTVNFTGDDLDNDLGDGVITVTGKDFSTEYIPDSSNATFAVPDTAEYLAADGDDNFWFDSGGNLQQKTVDELILSETMHTFVKYEDTSPYNISAIGILKDGEVLTEADKEALNTYFRLWFIYWGTIMDSGYMKDNRTLP